MRKSSARRWLGRRQMGRGSGPPGAWVPWLVGLGSVAAISAGHLLQVLDERVELVRGQGLTEVRRHDPTSDPLLDEGVGVGDGGADEALALALEVLVEVGPDGAGRGRVGERVAAAAAVRGED